MYYYLQMDVKKKILVAEDDLPIRMALVERLNFEGFETMETIDGQHTLDMALLKRPDLILLDILMPVMDGMLVLKKIRGANKWGEKVPIIILSNLDAQENIERSKKDNVLAYMVKSNTKLDEIVQKIKDSFREK